MIMTAVTLVTKKATVWFSVSAEIKAPRAILMTDIKGVVTFQ